MKQKKNRGITLIALVITIIIMLILVAVTVTYSLKSGLLDKTKYAKEEWKYNQASEEEYMSGEVEINGNTYYSIDDYVSGKEPKPTYPRITKICCIMVLNELGRVLLDDMGLDEAFGLSISKEKPKLSFDNSNNLYIEGITYPSSENLIPLKIKKHTIGIDMLDLPDPTLEVYKIILINSQNQIISNIDKNLSADNYTALLVQNEQITQQNLKILEEGNYYYGGTKWLTINTNKTNDITVYEAMKMAEEFDDSKITIGKFDFEQFDKINTIYKWNYQIFENKGIYYDGKEAYGFSGTIVYPLWYDQSFLNPCFEIANKTYYNDIMKNADFCDKSCTELYMINGVLNWEETLGEDYPKLTENDEFYFDLWLGKVETFLKQKNYTYNAEEKILLMAREPGPKITIK